jgi:hypothetical protein
MKANLMNRTIEMTKSEAKAAGRINSEKFNELKNYQNAYPTFTIAIIETPKKKTQYRGLDYKFMENYIKKSDREDKDEIMNKFDTLRGKANDDRAECEKAEVASYIDVKKWFLKTFPEIKEFKEAQSKKIAEILNVA